MILGTLISFFQKKKDEYMKQCGQTNNSMTLN